MNLSACIRVSNSSFPPFLPHPPIAAICRGEGKLSEGTEKELKNTIDEENDVEVTASDKSATCIGMIPLHVLSCSTNMFYAVL